MNNIWKKLEFLFYSVCWITAISFAICCIYKFGLDKDLCTITFKKFHDNDEDILPSLTLCLKDPYVRNNVTFLNGNVNTTSILPYLLGLEEIPKSLNLRYEDLAIDMNKYVLGYWVRYRNGSTNTIYTKYQLKQLFATSYLGVLSMESGFYHCSAIQIPSDEDIQILSVLMDDQVLRMENKLGIFHFLTTLHYPNQFLRSYNTIKRDWPKRAKYAGYTIRFIIDTVEVLCRRNKWRYPCYDNWENYDDIILRKHIKKVGCRAPYQQPNSTVPICKTKYEMKNSILSLRTDDYGFSPPCKSLEKITYRIEEETFHNSSEYNIDDTFWIGLYLPQTFKEIEETRAIDIQTLIGNISGYIGLCLGYSLLQIPRLVRSIAKKILKRYQFQWNKEEKEIKQEFKTRIYSARIVMNGNDITIQMN